MPFSKDPSSYPEEYLELFRRGYEAPFVVELPSQAIATSTRHRLHAYRRALQAASSPFYPLAASCEIRVEGNKLRVQPKAMDLRQALSSAGVSLKPSLNTTLDQEEEEATASLEKVLASQGYGKDESNNES